MNKGSYHFFTMIELITVITVISVLSLIVLMNINDIQKEATDTSFSSELHSIQIAVDLFKLDNQNKLPSNKQPTELIPEPLLFNKLYPNYIRTNTKQKEMYYWVDFQGKVWGSTIDSPTNVLNDNGVISFNKVKNANYYKIYQVEYSTNSSSLKKNISLTYIDKIENPPYNQGVENATYLISSIDSNGFESAPVGEGYLGYKKNKLLVSSLSLNALVMEDINQTNTSANIISISNNKIIYNNKIIGMLGGDYKKGDEVMLYASSGKDSTEIGHYRFFRILDVNDNEITVDRNVDSIFKPSTSQVIKVPEYSNLTIGKNTSISPAIYDGNKGGILVLKVKGVLTLEENAKIDASFKGYQDTHLQPNGGLLSFQDNAGGTGGTNQFRGGLGGAGNKIRMAPLPKEPIGYKDIISKHKIYFGGAGGKAAGYYGIKEIGTGGTGGGIIIIESDKIVLRKGSIISSNGEGGKRGVSNGWYHGAGGGAGGSIVIASKEIEGMYDFFAGATGGGGASAGGGQEEDVNEGYSEDGFNGTNYIAGKGGNGYYFDQGLKSVGEPHKWNGSGGGCHTGSINPTEEQAGKGGDGYIPASGGGGGGGYIAIYTNTNHTTITYPPSYNGLYQKH